MHLFLVLVRKVSQLDDLIREILMPKMEIINNLGQRITQASTREDFFKDQAPKSVTSLYTIVFCMYFNQPSQHFSFVINFNFRH